MASSGPNNLPTASPIIPDEAQLKRDDTAANQQHSQQNQDQSPNFLQDTGAQVKNMAQGAADIGKGAAQGAINITKGAALGAANVAEGTANVLKNTFGVNNNDRK